MTDLKKVIKAVECRKNVHKRCGNPCEQIGNCEYAAWVRDSDGEPYYPCFCDTEKLCDDILFLLKEQEAKPPVVHTLLGVNYYYCPGCARPITKSVAEEQPRYCKDCGKGLKWYG